MHVVDVGQGTPLVALHGFGVDHRILIGLDATFEAAGGWRRLYPDLPGTAQTPIGDAASTADVVGLVSQMLDEQVGTEPFAILGSSWGGLIARQIAHERRSQVLGLALLVPLVVADPESRDAPDRVVLHEDPEAAGSLGELRAEYEAMSVVQSPENVELWSQYVWSGAEGIDTVGQERIRERYGVEPVPEERWPEPFLMPTLNLYRTPGPRHRVPRRGSTPCSATGSNGSAPSSDIPHASVAHAMSERAGAPVWHRRGCRSRERSWVHPRARRPPRR
jgi:pimeloyl-ACP methyl ester carboxylesterase